MCNGELLVRDGPFAKTRDEVAGYDVIECADFDEAIEIASKHAAAKFGMVEVRAVWESWYDWRRNKNLHQANWDVFVPVVDQDRALAFYLDKLGFEKRADFPYGDGSRWIEVAPPGAANTISLVALSEGKSAGGGEAHCAFTTQDILADHTTLGDRGVDVDAEIAGKGIPRSGLISIEVVIPDPVPSQFFFRDIDGNRFLIVQPDWESMEHLGLWMN
jgi:catechol 2,3-dioxygenase-like lactoylglutathione lyase family enzyme